MICFREQENLYLDIDTTNTTSFFDPWEFKEYHTWFDTPNQLNSLILGLATTFFIARGALTIMESAMHYPDYSSRSIDAVHILRILSDNIRLSASIHRTDRYSLDLSSTEEAPLSLLSLHALPMNAEQ